MYHNDIYAHFKREAKRTSARLLDKASGMHEQKNSLVSAHKSENKRKYIRNEFLKPGFPENTKFA